MAINIFKKTSSAKPEAKKEVKKEIIEKKVSRPLKVGKKVIAYGVLKSPRITEKATALAEENKYVFDVFPKSNKKEVKEAVEAVYNVDVVKVNIIKVPRKPKRRGRVEGFKKGYKKAIVQIKKDQKIELLPR